MEIHNPKILAILLEDLNEELTRWAAVTQDTIRASRSRQEIIHERFQHLQRRIQIIEGQVADFGRDFESKKTSTSLLISQCEEAIGISEAVLKRAQNNIGEIERTLLRWQTELSQAQQKYHAMQERIESAQQVIVGAEEELSAMKAQLAAATETLQSCRDTYTVDNQGRRKYRDCRAQEKAMQNAQEVVTNAQAKLAHAQAALANMQQEQQNIAAFMICCQEAITIASQAQEEATKLQTYVSSALGSAERSKESTDAAERELMKAYYEIAEIQRDVNRMLHMATEIQQAIDDEGQSRFQQAARLEEEAQRFRVLTSSELTHRINLLYVLNRADLFTHTFIGAISPFKRELLGTSSVQLALTENVSQPTLTCLDITRLPTLDPPETLTETRKNELHRYLERLPLMAAGTNLQNREYWVERDKAEGYQENNGYTGAYDLLFRHEPILLWKKGEEYHIQRGHDIIWLAQQQGLSILPVYVLELHSPQPPLSQSVALKTIDVGKEHRHDTPHWHIHLYQEKNQLMIRIFDLNRRTAIPQKVDQGDGGHLDVLIKDEFAVKKAVITDYDVVEDQRWQGLQHSLFTFAEDSCRSCQVSSIYMVIAPEVATRNFVREWFHAHGYAFRVERRQTIVYKLFKETMNGKRNLAI